jgi:heme-degrading monooxygenase HmoA
MHARVSTYKGDAEALRQGFDSVSGGLREINGFKNAYFMIDRDSGKGVSVTLWESEEALRESVSRADELRNQATQPSGASIESVESYEVVVTA